MVLPFLCGLDEREYEGQEKRGDDEAYIEDDGATWIQFSVLQALELIPRIAFVSWLKDAAKA